jgi:hypothetical protein
MCFIGVFVFVDVVEAAAFTDASVLLETSNDTSAINMSKDTSLIIKDVKVY